MRDLKEIFKAVRKVGFTKGDILSKNRKQPLALVRQVAVWLAREGRTLKELGDIFNRNHAACLHSVRQVDNRLSYNDLEVAELMAKMEVAQ